MKRMWRKTLSLLLSGLMIVSVLSVQPSHAAIEYFHFTDYSTDKNAPTQVNSGTIEIAGTYNGVATDSMYFKIETVLSDGSVVAELNGAGVSPILEGTNGFRFTNVKLPAAGLNKITVFGKSSGNFVSNVAYVYYPNVPTIYNIKLADNRTLASDEPTLVNTPTITLLLKAPNATNVTVQGQSALSGGGDDYLASNIELEPGLNKLSFVASNGTMTYSITRDVVYYDDRPTAFDVKISTTSLEGNPTVGPNDTLTGHLIGKISGKLAVEVDPSSTLDLDVQIKNNSGSYDVSDTLVTTTFDKNVTVTGATYSYAIYNFTTTISYDIQTSDDYQLYVKGTYGSDSVNFPLLFTYRSGTSPIIQEVRQLYNVTEPTSPSTTVVSTSNSAFTDNLVFFQAPIWIAVKAKNFDLANANHIATLTTTQGGVTVGSPQFTYVKNVRTYYSTASGEIVFKITNLPAGEQVLNIKLLNNTTHEEVIKNIPLTFVPTPFIQLDNIFNGKTFTDSTAFTSIQGKLVNFNLGSSADINSIKVTVNGTTLPMAAASINTTTGAFTYNIPNGVGQNLVDGPNTITISGTANGIPVSNSVTVYLFSDKLPRVQNLIPVPVGATVDTGKKFILGEELSYTTNEKTMDVLFNVFQADSVSVSIDGTVYTSATGASLTPADAAKMTNTGAVSGGGTGFRLNSIPLPASGLKSVTITVAKGTATSSMTLQVTRVQVPFMILSPKLPDEQVINQNFIQVSIRAEGADSILIGKQEMEKGTDDIFRGTVDGLKNGNNTIKFTITTGTTKANGQFIVNYASQNEVGAQFKTTMPTSGKLTAFNGDLSIAFPKGTLLRDPEKKNLSNVPQVDLFNTQKLLLGIADKNDGRTIKRYNRVGEFVSGVPQDGTLADIAPVGISTNLLQGTRTQFGYASELFWVDAGYLAGGTTYQTVDGMQPYERGKEFYVRGQDSSKWLVPTNRGTITLKYDSNIRNESAKNLSVWYFSNNSWKNLGGTINTGKKTITAPMDGFGYYAVMNVRYGFDDITGHPYARNQLDTMFAKGIMQPKSSNLFGVYDNITRGEFATMIVKMLDLPLNYDTSANLLTFSDVPPINVPGALWDYRYIETAARAGIISGLAPRAFNPGGFLTREQAAVIIARAMNYKLGDPNKDKTSLAKQFTDAGSIDYYAIPHIQAVVKAKIMSGQEVQPQAGQTKSTFVFNPKSNLNRADMAVIAYNIMVKLKRI
ncbi:S-layer homology domain-containing protein [Cohnella caldifontis]|uniref:S-layer homology domain-containing protein n=1 Tax=Cohnella caldifontis TaxID=3027471 RepID=UPI0023EB88B0|nr:S-layer homology domain-containing protein [Cohnella sp. YIM B05605]